MDVKWIKLTTNMFDDDKIKLIESMPEKDTVLIIWVKLLIQAGKTNASGFIYLNERIPYSDEMLAAIFCRPINTVRLALDILSKFEMIEKNDTGIFISNWEKHQNVKGLDELKAKNAERVAAHRKRKKELEQDIKKDINKDIELDIEGNVTCNVTKPLLLPAPKQRKAADNKESEIPESLNAPEFLRAWEEWRQHRKEKKSPLTPLAIKKQFNQLEKIGMARAIAAIDHSILKCWLSINEDQYSNKPKAEVYPDAMAELTAKYGKPIGS